MTNPGIRPGYVPTASEWNSYFDAKQDVLGFVPLSSSGGTLTGKVTLAASTNVQAGASIPPGVAPASPINGDFWTTATGLFIQLNGSTVNLTGSGGTGAGGTGGGGISGFTGGTLTGPLILAPSTTGAAGLNIAPGTPPTSPNNGDVWVTSSGYFARVNGSSINLSALGNIDSLTLKATPASNDEVALWDVSGAAIKKATVGTLGPSDVLKFDVTATISKGYTITPFNAGTFSSGTFTPDPTQHNYQYLTNNGAFTIAAPSSDCAIDMLITNGVTAGTITFSGFTVGTTGDALDTTNGHKFILSTRRINSVAMYFVKALQ